APRVTLVQSRYRCAYFINSAWRPGELPAPENVEVEVPHALPREVAVVHHEPEGVRVSRLRRDRSDDAEQVAAQRLVAQLGERWDMVSGHDEDMDGGVGMEVVHRAPTPVLMDDLPRDLAGDDPADHAVGHVGTIAACSSRS